MPAALLDLGVGIDERQAEPGGQPAADRGLAGAHHADQHDRTARRARATIARFQAVFRGCFAWHGSPCYEFQIDATVPYTSNRDNRVGGS